MTRDLLPGVTGVLALADGTILHQESLIVHGTVSGTVAMSADTTVGVTGSGLTLSGVLSGSFALTKTGTSPTRPTGARTPTCPLGWPGAASSAWRAWTPGR